MVVTAIRQTSSDRLIVTLDEAEEIKTTLGVVTEHRLYNGAELDDAAAEALRRDSARALARDRALGSAGVGRHEGSAPLKPSEVSIEMLR